MSRKLLVLLGSTIVVTLLVMSALLAIETAAAASVTVNGSINTIDPAKKQITIKESNGATVNLKIVSSSKITRNGKKSTLKGLTLRDSITAHFDASSHDASSLIATGPAVATSSGKVKNASRGTGVLTIGSKKFHTSANTTISRNGQIVSLSQITRSDSVTVHTKSGSNNALDVIDDGPSEAEVEGTITGVDTTGNTVTIAPSNGTPSVTLAVTSTTMIELDDNPATLSELQVNMHADAEYDPTSMTSFSIEAESASEEADVTGTVAGVDLTNNTITISPTVGSSITLSVTAATQIQVNDEDATLADVQVGMPVQAQYDTATLVAQEIDAGSNGSKEGNQESVDGTVAVTTTTSVTINPNESGNPITLTVDASTRITIDDSPGTLDQIPLGASIEAEYDTTTMIASDLDVQTGGEDKPSH
jgi:hypothetical protein